MAKRPEKKTDEAYRKLKKDLSAGELGSLYIFHGEEAYLRDYYLDQMKAKLIPAGMESFNYHLLPGKTLTAQKLAETVDALPMMSPRTLLVAETDPAGEFLGFTVKGGITHDIRDNP